ncbi:MAG: HAMP domain-containing protein [Streptosporangiales bacterium]|nr:HAMP domain-containing protein [Streptosporangiales bacterium]
MRWLPRSLRGRIVLGFALGASAALVLCLVFLYMLLDRQLGAALDSGLTGRAADLTTASTGGDVSVIRRDPMAQLYTSDGSVVASSASLDGRLLDVREVRVVDGEAFSTRRLSLRQGQVAEPVRLLSRQLTDGRVLTVGVSAGPVEAAGVRLLVVLLVAAPLLVGILSAAGWLVVRAALRPVGVLTKEAAAISSFDTDRRLPTVPGDDEIARLARTLDDMLARLDVAFARERTFVDDASHELRTPIAVLRGEIELALSAADDPAEVERSLRAALGQADRLAELADDLLLLARAQDGRVVVERKPVDVLDLAAAEAGALERALGLRVAASGAPVVVAGDANRLRQVLANLAANSAAAGAATVQVHVSRGRDTVTIEVSDDGPGFPPHLMASAFERFVRGDHAPGRQAGAGLGLSIVHALVTAHRGTVTIGNAHPHGAVVTITLPADLVD